MNKLFLIIITVLALSSCKNTNKQDTTTNTKDTLVVVPDSATTKR